MQNLDYFKDKKVLIIGLARSGFACANLLLSLQAKVSVTDNQENESIRKNASELSLRGIKVEFGKHTQDFIKDNDIVIISPGVPNESLAVKWAKELKIPIISEIELGFILCPAQIIAITGTNGKTTVTTLITKVLEKAGKRVFTCGNIGRPFSSEVGKMRKGDFVSLEVSSFQLETIDTFKPRIAAILNLSRNHLDRYSDMSDYLKAKKRIFKNQDASDFLILNQEDPLIRELANEAKAKVIYFSKKDNLNPNQCAVLSICEVLGIDKDLILKVFAEFKGVEHRMEEVSKLNGIKFINDSKSTTTEATVWALNNLSCPVILIAGGREKGNDYSAVLNLAKTKVKSVILIGEAREKIKKAFNDLVDLKEADSLKEAVSKAYSKAVAGDCILFSPMCKSFDMFSNYEERGKVFKEIVANLK